MDRAFKDGVSYLSQSETADLLYTVWEDLKYKREKRNQKAHVCLADRTSGHAWDEPFAPRAIDAMIVDATGCVSLTSS